MLWELGQNPRRRPRPGQLPVNTPTPGTGAYFVLSSGLILSFDLEYHGLFHVFVCLLT
jgi:hypothetical protein